MFDYLYSIIASLVSTTATFVGVQSAQPVDPQPTTRFEDRDERQDFFDDSDGRRPEELDDILRDIQRTPRAMTEYDVYGYGDAPEIEREYVSRQDDHDEWEDEDEWEEYDEDEDEDEEEDGDDGDRRGGARRATAATGSAPVVIVQQPVPAVTPAAVSIAAVQKHNTAKDCWVVYQGVVYDITALIPWHPGGASAITPYCGTSQDFSRAFTGQHGTSQVSTLMKRAQQKGRLQ